MEQKNHLKNHSLEGNLVVSIQIFNVLHFEATDF